VFLDLLEQTSYSGSMFGSGLTEFIITGGLFVIAATVFAECAFLFGFFLPGDTLLFLAGFIAGEGQHNIVVTILLILIAATIGNVVGYYIGQRTGPRVFSREDGILFKKDHILQAQQFYEKHGGKTLILARFIPILRTFAPFVAGIANMSFGKFLAYSTAGAALWAVVLPSIGFWAFRVLGHSIDIEKYVLPIVGGIMIVSIGGSAFHAVREGRRHRSRTKAADLAKNQSKVEEQID
jgi:membrane-associated protein